LASGQIGQADPAASNGTGAFLPLTISPMANDASFFLDVLRIVASQMVLLGHAISAFGCYSALDYPRSFYLQNLAVVIFFMISGFLISHTVRRGCQKGGYSFAGYAIDRGARIYSGYFPALLFVACVDEFMIHHGHLYAHAAAFNVKTAFGNLLMLQDFPGLHFFDITMTSFGSARPFWTLAVEMWIYLFFGAAVLWGRDGYRPLQLGALLVLAIVPVANLFGGRGKGLFACWLLGALVEYVLHAQAFRRISSRYLILLLVASSGAYGLYLRREKEVYGLVSYVPLFVAFSCALALAMRSRLTVDRQRLRKVISYLAGYSFSLYLIHYTVLEAAVTFLGRGQPRMMWSAIVAANLVALALASFTERRHRDLAGFLRRKFLRPDAPLDISTSGQG
jgi:peptidoglycan/LPS O-acetylase OafA/YrhL